MNQVWNSYVRNFGPQHPWSGHRRNLDWCEPKATMKFCFLNQGHLGGDDSQDEIDIEILGGKPKEWQTNVFVPTPKNPGPMYNVFSSTESIDGSITTLHSYSVDLNSDRIVWSVDGKIARTLTKGVSVSNDLPALRYLYVFQRTNTQKWGIALSNTLSTPSTGYLGCEQRTWDLRMGKWAH